MTDNQTETPEPFAEYPDIPSEDMSDSQLYDAYNYTKQHGPQLRLDALQLEVAQRWEAQQRKTAEHE